MNNARSVLLGFTLLIELMNEVFWPLIPIKERKGRNFSARKLGLTMWEKKTFLIWIKSFYRIYSRIFSHRVKIKGVGNKLYVTAWLLKGLKSLIMAETRAADPIELIPISPH